MTFRHISEFFLTLLLQNFHKYIFPTQKCFRISSVRQNVKICAKYFSPRAQIQLAAVGRTISPQQLFTNLVFSFQIFSFNFSNCCFWFIYLIFSCFYAFAFVFLRFDSVSLFVLLLFVLSFAERSPLSLALGVAHSGNSRRPLCSTARKSTSYCLMNFALFFWNVRAYVCDSARLCMYVSAWVRA